MCCNVKFIWDIVPYMKLSTEMQQATLFVKNGRYKKESHKNNTLHMFSGTNPRQAISNVVAWYEGMTFLSCVGLINTR